jgi:hypothetical protein
MQKIILSSKLVNNMVREKKGISRIKKVNINGFKVNVILPPNADFDSVPSKLKSRNNHPKGLLLKC